MAAGLYLLRNAQAPRYFWGHAASARLTDLDHQTSFGGRLVDLAGRSVLLATESQLTTALALMELDGIARRLVILPPDAEVEHIGAVITAADIDAAVIDDGTSANAALDLSVRVLLRAVDRADDRKLAVSRSHRMGAYDIGHDWRAEDGHARSRRAHGGHSSPEPR